MQPSRPVTVRMNNSLRKQTVSEHDQRGGAGEGGGVYRRSCERQRRCVSQNKHFAIMLKQVAS
jgi:hypothetical protein